MKIMKFGGSSLRDAAAFKRVADILNKTQGRKLAVLSASSGITDKLILMSKSAAENIFYCRNLFREIIDFQISLANDLLDNYLKEAVSEIRNIESEIKDIVDGIGFLGECPPFTTEKLPTFGEYFSGVILHYYLKETGIENTLIDSADFIRIKKGGPQDWNSEFIQIFSKIYAGYDTIISQGYVSTNEEGRRVNLGRGGSDLTASLFGKFIKKAGIDNPVIELWKDVDGLLTGNPRVISNPLPVKRLSLGAIGALAEFGAKLLHPKSMKPAVENEIPARIKNTFSPENAGTEIVPESDFPGPVIHTVLVPENSHFRKKNGLVPIAIVGDRLDSGLGPYKDDFAEFIKLYDPVSLSFGKSECKAVIFIRERDLDSALNSLHEMIIKRLG